MCVLYVMAGMGGVLISGSDYLFKVTGWELDAHVKFVSV